MMDQSISSYDSDKLSACSINQIISKIGLNDYSHSNQKISNPSA
jgi:hypothetical protein